MRRLFDPAVALMNRLRFPQKCVLLCLLFLLPLAFALSQLMFKFQAEADLANAELRGTTYLRPVSSLLRHVAEHQALINGFEGGNIANDAQRPSILAKQAEIDADLAELGQLDARLGPALDSGTAFQAVQRDWQSAEPGAPTGADAEVRLPASKLVTDVHALMTKVGNSSQLIINPVQDSYTVMNLVVVVLPAQEDLLTQLRSLAVNAARDKGATQAELVQMDASAGLLRSNVAMLQDSSGSGLLLPRATGLSAPLGAPLAGASDAGTAFLSSLAGLGVNSDPREIDRAGAAALDASFRLWDESTDTLDTIIQGRVDGISFNEAAIAVSAALAGMLVLYLLVGLYLAVTRTVRQLDAAAHSMAAGEVIGEVKLDNHDELGEVVGAFNRIAAALVADIAERKRAEALAKELHARGESLQQQVTELRIEIDEVRLARDLEAITNADYFEDVRRRGQLMRKFKEQQAVRAGG
jgi:HAMP domain-containing protein